MNLPEQRSLILQIEASNSIKEITPLWEKLSTEKECELEIISSALSKLFQVKSRIEVPGEPF